MLGELDLLHFWSRSPKNPTSWTLSWTSNYFFFLLILGCVSASTWRACPARLKSSPYNPSGSEVLPSPYHIALAQASGSPVPAGQERMLRLLHLGTLWELVPCRICSRLLSHASFALSRCWRKFVLTLFPCSTPLLPLRTNEFCSNISSPPSLSFPMSLFLLFFFSHFFQLPSCHILVYHETCHLHIYRLFRNSVSFNWSLASAQALLIAITNQLFFIWLIISSSLTAIGVPTALLH